MRPGHLRICPFPVFAVVVLRQLNRLKVYSLIGFDSLNHWVLASYKLIKHMYLLHDTPERYCANPHRFLTGLEKPPLLRGRETISLCIHYHRKRYSRLAG